MGVDPKRTVITPGLSDSDKAGLDAAINDLPPTQRAQTQADIQSLKIKHKPLIDAAAASWKAEIPVLDRIRKEHPDIAKQITGGHDGHRMTGQDYTDAMAELKKRNPKLQEEYAAVHDRAVKDHGALFHALDKASVPKTTNAYDGIKSGILTIAQQEQRAYIAAEKAAPKGNPPPMPDSMRRDIVIGAVESAAYEQATSKPVNKAPSAKPEVVAPTVPLQTRGQSVTPRSP